MQDASPPSPRQLRAIRAWFDWTLDEAAEKLSVSKNTLSIYESGSREIAEGTLAIITLKLQGLGITVVNGEIMLAA